MKDSFALQNRKINSTVSYWYLKASCSERQQKSKWRWFMCFTCHHRSRPGTQETLFRGSARLLSKIKHVPTAGNSINNQYITSKKDSLLKYTKQDKCPTTYPVPFLLLTISFYKSNFAWLRQKPGIPGLKFPWWMQSWRASSTIFFRGKILLPRCTPEHERITSDWQSRMRPANDSALYPANTT